MPEGLPSTHSSSAGLLPQSQTHPQACARPCASHCRLPLFILETSAGRPHWAACRASSPACARAGSETNLSFDEPDFALIDTLFSLAEAHLFMQLVEIKDGELAELPPGKSYADLYRWVSEVNWTRASV